MRRRLGTKNGCSSVSGNHSADFQACIARIVRLEHAMASIIKALQEQTDKVTALVEKAAVEAEKKAAELKKVAEEPSLDILDDEKYPPSPSESSPLLEASPLPQSPVLFPDVSVNNDDLFSSAISSMNLEYEKVLPEL